MCRKKHTESSVGAQNFVVMPDFAETQNLASLRVRLSRQFALLLVSFFIVVFVRAQAPAGYYAAAEGQSGEALRTALYNIIRTHSSVSYAELWNAFYTTDVRPDNGKVWDMYSDRPGSSPNYYRWCWSTSR